MIHGLRFGRNCSCSTLAPSWPEILNIAFFCAGTPALWNSTNFIFPTSFAPVYMGEALHKCIYMLVWWPTVLNNTSNLSPKLETPFRYAFWPEGNWMEFRYKALDELIYLKQNFKRFIQLAPFLPHTPDKNKRLPQWIWKDIKVMFTFSYFLSSFFDIHARKNWKRQNIHNDLELPLSKVG